MALEESDLQLRQPQTAPASTSLNADSQFHRLLVPLDGSPLAEAVLPYVRRLASPHGTRVILVTVINPAPAVAAVETPAAAQIIVEAEERDRIDAQTYLERMRTRLTGEGLDVVPVLMTGDPATIIDQLAREHEVELIAMTTHGRTGLGRLVFGSVAEHVIRSAPVPVFLVRVSGEAEARRAA